MSEKLSTKPYKGSRDFYPQEMRFRTWMFNRMSEIVESYGYEKVDSALIEPVDLYLAKTSEEIVNQQIYSFLDRGERKVAIRPEMTPTVARMVAGKVRELPKPIRWYSIPNLWRYEKPGKGRLREHWQLNADLFNARDEKLADTEILQLAIELMKGFGADKSQFVVYLNHREILNSILGNILKVPKENWTAVARIMDKKEKVSADVYEEMLEKSGLNTDQKKDLSEYLDQKKTYIKNNKDQIGPSADYLLQILDTLDELGYKEFIQYNPSVVRGFDYYTGIVFEVFDTAPENRRSLFGGGRYDNLAGAFIKENINAVGFGMGDVTFADFLRTHKLYKDIPKNTQIYMASFTDSKASIKAMQLAVTLRNSGYRVENFSGEKKLKKQLDEANAKSIPIVLILADDELENDTISLKNMISGEQKSIKTAELLTELNLFFKDKL